MCGQPGHSFAECTLLQNALQVATACGKLKSIMDRACCLADSIHKAINPSSTPTNAPSVAPIQLLRPSVASPDISALAGPALLLPAFGVSIIPPSNDHPSDPASDDSSGDTDSTMDHQNLVSLHLGLSEPILNGQTQEFTFASPDV